MARSTSTISWAFRTLEARMLRAESLHEGTAARERVVPREVGGSEVREVIERRGRVRGRKGVDEAGNGREGARLHAHRALDGRGVRALAVVERRPRIDRRQEHRGGRLAAPSDEHHGGVRLVEVRQVVEGGKLVERAEVGHGISCAEGDDDAVADARREGITAGREFRLGDLCGARQGDGGRQEQRG